MISEGLEAARFHQARNKANPDLAEYKKQFGNKVKVNEQTGEFDIRLTDRADVRRAYEMHEKARRMEVERGYELHDRAARNSEKVVRRDGKVVSLPAELVDQVKHRLRTASRNGRSGRLAVGLSGATDKYVRGLDQLDFVWNDGWEPAPLFTPKASGPQRDPDGNVWVKGQSGDWVLESEA